MVLEATAGIREGIREVLKAHIATLIGGEFSVQELASQVFNNKPSWTERAGDKWIDQTMRRAVERHAEQIIEELLTERKDELRETIKVILAGKDVAGMMADAVVKRIDSSR
jgi:uncharacterized membrane protein YraQ (UPF0718 family)